MENPEGEPSWLECMSTLEIGLPEGASATVSYLPGSAKSPSASATADFVTPQAEAEADPNATAMHVSPGADPSATAASLAAQTEPEFAGQIGRYEILDKLGEGGMGAVYLAKEAYLRRRVALKQTNGTADEATARFVTEAQITAQLDHPGIIPIYALEISDDGTVAYSMKPVAGHTLAERIEQARTHFDTVGHRDAKLSADLDDLLDVFVRVCEALEFAHSHGVLHRDLKPENIMIGAHREVYVMDWGLAKLTGRDEFEENGRVELSELDDLPAGGQTRSGTIKGTPLYMAPEQAAGKANRLTRAADIYALGVILHELVYLQRFRAGSTLLEAVTFAKSNARVPAPEGLDDAVELDAVVSLATRTEPSARYTSAQELGDDVRRVLLGDETRALPDRGWRKIRRWVSHHPSFALTCAVAAIAAFTLILGLLVQRQQVLAAEARLHAQRESRALSQLVSVVSERTRALALHFQGLGKKTEGIAARAAELLEHDPQHAPQPPLVDAGDFETEATAPPGSTRSSRYGDRLVHPRRAIGFAPPGAAGERDLRRMAAMLGQLRACFSNSSVRLSEHEALDAAIVAHDAPLEWSYVALENSGTIVLFPGSTSNFAPDYDPRQRAWYRDAVAHYQATGVPTSWSRPYLDLMGQGVVLTATQVVLSDQGEVSGVAALDLTFGGVVQKVLSLSSVPGFVNATLLDGAGNVILATDHEVPMGPDGVIDRVAHAHPAVVKGVRAGTSSLVQHLDAEGNEHVTVWTTLPQLGWAVAVEVSYDALLLGYAPPGSR